MPIDCESILGLKATAHMLSGENFFEGMELENNIYLLLCKAVLNNGYIQIHMGQLNLINMCGVMSCLQDVLQFYKIYACVDSTFVFKYIKWCKCKWCKWNNVFFRN